MREERRNFSATWDNENARRHIYHTFVKSGAITMMRGGEGEKYVSTNPPLYTHEAVHFPPSSQIIYPTYNAYEIKLLLPTPSFNICVIIHTNSSQKYLLLTYEYYYVVFCSISFSSLSSSSSIHSSTYTQCVKQHLASKYGLFFFLDSSF